LDALGGSGYERRRGVAEEVRAEMVSTVLKVSVSEGDTVKDGETLVILESMKMEIPIIAEASGTVRRVCVAKNDSVQAGDLIVVID